MPMIGNKPFRGAKYSEARSRNRENFSIICWIFDDLIFYEERLEANHVSSRNFSLHFYAAATMFKPFHLTLLVKERNELALLVGEANVYGYISFK